MLRKRLEETEAAMERIVAQMGSVSDRLSPSILAQVLKAQSSGPIDSVIQKVSLYMMLRNWAIILNFDQVPKAHLESQNE